MRSLECADSIPLLHSNEKSDMQFKQPKKGINWVIAAAFIVADMAGGGVVTMPVALLKSGGLIGGLVIFVVATAFCYTAHLLGENWTIMKKRWPEYSSHCRKPYPEMAFRAIGPKARLLTVGTIHAMLFGVSVVYLLLSAKIINNLISSLMSFNIGECRMLVALAVVLFPVTLLKSPQDFWIAVVLAMVTTVIAVILIVAGILKDHGVCGVNAHFPLFNSEEFIMSLGIFMFAFGGHAVFPTIINDMRRPKEFTKSAFLGFLGVCILYLPVTVLGYAVYGDSLTDSIISSIQSKQIQEAANLFIAAHCVLTLTITINPLNQELENSLGLPHGFGVGRVAVRAFILSSVTFLALSIPSFGPLLNVIGGTTVALTSAVLPCLFSMFLKAMERDVTKAGYLSLAQAIKLTPWPRLIANFLVIVLAILFGTVTTISAWKDLYVSEMSAPCYSMNYHITISQTNHCCGPFRNISSIGETCYVHLK
uniref:Aa_trans domain-containing protein n=1 Tax=Bursaphelenchus xylophilus TaxID=6326 RepID=A0A1I7SWI0_BURXY